MYTRIPSVRRGGGLHGDKLGFILFVDLTFDFRLTSLTTGHIVGKGVCIHHSHSQISTEWKSILHYYDGYVNCKYLTDF